MASAGGRVVSAQPRMFKVYPALEQEAAGDNLDLAVNTCNNAKGSSGGLEALASTDMVFVKEQVKLLETFCCCELNNEYDVLNNRGKKIFTAKEKTCWCTRYFCGPCRPFTIEICDLQGNVCLTIKRPLRVCHCCCPTCCQQITVLDAQLQPVGFVSQQCSLKRPMFEIQSKDSECLFLIKGPCRCIPYCCRTDFKITSQDGYSKVGRLTKKWSGGLKEMFTDADNFGVEFPVHLNVDIKSTILAAVFLIDFMYFEESANRKTLC